MNPLPVYEITGNSKAHIYLQRELAAGTSLSRLVYNRCDLNLGRLFVAVPEVFDLRNSVNFDSSLMMQYAEKRSGLLIDLIVKSFNIDSGHAILLQDTQATVDDGWLQSYELRTFAVTYGAEVYWRLTGENTPIPDEQISGFISSASHYPFAGFFYLPHRPAPDQKLTDRDFEEVINTLMGIVVGAFDEDSFLFWWSDNIPFPVAIEPNKD